MEKKQMTISEIHTKLVELQKDQKRASAQLDCYLNLYQVCLESKYDTNSLYIDQPQKSDLDKSAMESAEELVDYAIESIDRNAQEFKELKESFKSLDVSITLDLVSRKTGFDFGFFDDVELLKIEQNREVMRADKNFGRLDDESLNEALLTDEEVLMANPPTVLDYELYVEGLDAEEESSVEKGLLFKIKNYEELSLFFLQMELSFIGAYYKIYSFRGDAKKIDLLMKRKEEVKLEIESIKKKISSTNGRIGNESRRIKALKAKKIEYYNNKITKMRNSDFGYERK